VPRYRRRNRRVDYRFDPEQEYVVAEIETRGAWSNGERPSEIGTVKGPQS
jgi:DNA polymerase-3 subunit epsilon